MIFIRTLFATVLICLLTLSTARAQQIIFDLYHSGDYETVVQQASRAIETGDTLFNTFYLKALSEAQLGRTEHAIQTLEMANAEFPEDIRIMEASECPDDFHPRYSAVNKSYVYFI